MKRYSKILTRSIAATSLIALMTSSLEARLQTGPIVNHEVQQHRIERLAKHKRVRVGAMWAMTLYAEDADSKLKSVETRFGQIKKAKKGVDAYDQESFPSWPKLAVNFEADGPGSKYKGDYHNITRWRGDEWNFVVTSSDVNRAVTLRWSELQKVVLLKSKAQPRPYKRIEAPGARKLRRLLLIDLKTGEKIPAVIDGKLQSYTFNMEGEKTRRFKWKFLSVREYFKSRRLAHRNMRAKRRLEKIYAKELAKSLRAEKRAKRHSSHHTPPPAGKKEIIEE
ncbi:hypothetical protein [Nitratifractor salsuginis]|uniref:Uncharacterized protein n=1 Tax=Nitratifractor salsuginis (strain DSM 16511 / JCM 12458 / E9I37-1) TaxID=749222 RepID=E6X1U2_NITSE|nr:hypothetical protein [Nitratifractor salsuginis]ADV45950.1 hypothetical protein Nitsa_0682 [Nitratifractor salsuginis DSM 16511]